LKGAAFIFILFTARIFAQVGPPNLRCLEVLHPNGEVKLTWIQPKDSLNKFSSYEIFSSISANGPFALIASSLGPITTNTFVHTAATASAQSRYYFMRTRFNNDADSSKNSDTLRSIFLNVFSGLNDLQLVYNNLRQPKLPSTSGSFTITKEQPLGTINVLAIQSGTTYADVIDICTVQINYQVSQSDQAGCISVSNLIIGYYEDTKVPDSTRIDSVSVLEDGRTALSWQIPADKDIIHYKIIENVNPQSPNSYVDIVNGRNSNFYIYQGLAATKNSLGLYVSAEDSCEGIGNFDGSSRTMYLIPIYDQCGYRTRLRWTAYRGLKGGVKEYRIYYSVNGGAYKRVGSTTDTSFVHEGADPSSDLCYFIRVVNNSESITASSNRVCFFSKQVTIPAFLYIQSADVTGDKSIQLRMYADNSIGMTGIDIFRSEDSVKYALAGYLPYTGSTNYVFNDVNVDPGSTSYYYKAEFRDSCDNSRSRSNICRTMLLQIKEDESNMFIKHLSWNGYGGFSGGVSGYNIYRFVNEIPTDIVHATMGPDVTNYTDNVEESAPQGARVDYFVEAVEGLGNSYGIKEESTSNVVSVYMEGQIFIPNVFTPAGANPVWTPVTHFVDRNEYRVRIFNRWGKMVFESTDPYHGWDGSNCIAGVYAYLISYKNSRGEYLEKAGSVALIR
jgi:hypothetical protein